MSRQVRSIFVGVAWPYVNDLFHIGNLAGAYLPPDIFSRFHKLRGNKILMVSGSDFYGTPITLRADKEKKKPEEIAKRFHNLDVVYLKKFNIEYSLFTSTHTSNHKRVSQEMFLRLLKNGFIEIRKTKQLYSEKSNKFFQDRYVEGKCPHCSAPDARGDQCETCGRVLDSLELVNPVSKIDKSKLVRKETENYFLNLSKLQDEVKRWLGTKTDMRDWIKKEALGWIKEGLHARAITRDMDYGVPLPISKIPKSQRIKNIKNKVLYVWFEAVIGYLSAAVEYSKNIKKPTYWKDFYYGKDGETYYFVGQDNLVFHVINWPAQLAAYDSEINLPTNVFVNKFLLLEGQKMSKSRGWFIDTEYLVENYPIDAIRFYLALNMPEQKELNFTWQEFIDTNNNILVATIGNFIHRVLTFSQKNFGNSFRISTHKVSSEVQSRINETFKESAVHLEKGEFRLATQEIVELAAFGNQYIDKHQVWNLIKEDKKKARAVVLDALTIIDALRILLYPVIPESAERLGVLLGQKKFILKEGNDQWLSQKNNIKLSSSIGTLFLKIDEKNIKKEVERLQQKGEEA
ncbi:methionine--tRNA ligase [Patescibacteria group bacterium]|nr:methionine--tRNA ligase [Patescibacteria group bacterium]